MSCRSAMGLALLLAVITACNKSEAPAESAKNEKATPTKQAAAGGEGKAATATPAGEATKEQKPATTAGEVDRAVLEDPAKATLEAPETFVVELKTTRGPIRLDVTRAWSPNGVDRFYNLVKAGYYTDVAFFRVIPRFMAQVGLHGDPAINGTWRSANIDDDPVKQSNTRGMVSFATAGPNTRTTQFFINFSDNNRLDGMGFSPFARVQADSMKVVDSLHGGYGEGAPRGQGPSQARIHVEGNKYLKADFPELDYIERAFVVEE